MVAAEVATQTDSTTEVPLASTGELIPASIEGQAEAVTAPEGTAQGQEATPTPEAPPPEPTEQEELEIARDLRERAQRGEAVRARTVRENDLLKRDDDRQITYENIAKQAVLEQQANARKLGDAHTAAQTKITKAVEVALAEAIFGNDGKIVLPASAMRLLEKDVQEANDELAAKSASIHLVPWLTNAAQVVHAVMENDGVTKDLYPRGTSNQVLQQLYSLPLTSSDGTRSLMGEVWRAGWAARNRQGPTAGSKSFTAAELAAHDKEVRESELNKVRRGGQPGNQGADGAKGADSGTSMEKYRAALKSGGPLPPSEEIDKITARYVTGGA